jgi:hypothetical protein
MTIDTTLIESTNGRVYGEYLYANEFRKTQGVREHTRAYL